MPKVISFIKITVLTTKDFVAAHAFFSFIRKWTVKFKNREKTKYNILTKLKINWLQPTKFSSKIEIFWPKFQFLSKIEIFGHQFQFLSKVKIVWHKFQFLSNIEIFGPKFQFLLKVTKKWPKFQFFINKIYMFYHNFDFSATIKKITVLTTKDFVAAHAFFHKEMNGQI